MMSVRSGMAGDQRKSFQAQVVEKSRCTSLRPTALDRKERTVHLPFQVSRDVQWHKSSKPVQVLAMETQLIKRC